MIACISDFKLEAGIWMKTCLEYWSIKCKIHTWLLSYFLQKTVHKRSRQFRGGRGQNNLEICWRIEVGKHSDIGVGGVKNREKKSWRLLWMPTLNLLLKNPFHCTIRKRLTKKILPYNLRQVSDVVCDNMLQLHFVMQKSLGK